MTFNEWYLDNAHLFDGTNMDAVGLKNAWHEMELEGVSEEKVYDLFSQIMNAILNC